VSRRKKQIYTPPAGKRTLRYRPGWHRYVGGVFAIAGLFVLFGDMTAQLGLWAPLPGGHNPLIMMVGLVLLGYSLRWFGWFDRQK
jgi:hypothetical protein